jgi:sulfite reductase (ferredoxin)
VGVVPVVERGHLVAFTVLVGGGMGRSHSDPTTFPRLADPVTTVAPGDLLDVVEAAVRVHRDFGDRTDRQHARLKYLVQDWGVDRFRDRLACTLGRPLPPAAPVTFDAAEDHLGWHSQGDDRSFLGIKVENGRIADRDGTGMRSAIRSVVERFEPGVRLTCREDLLLTDLADEHRAEVDALLGGHGVLPVEEWTKVGRNSFACPALPTCGLALTDAEGALPGILDELEGALAGLGLTRIDMHVRMTGCPNGCARPYTAEIGIVGRGKSRYDIHLAGEPVGMRLNERFAENVPRDELVNVLRPVLTHYRDHRDPGEAFGDFCQRIGVSRLRADLGTERWARPNRERKAEP